MPGRTYPIANTNYRYGFNGQEKSTEIDPVGNLYTAQFWEYDSRIGRRWNLDPIKKSWQSDYVTFSNTPIWKIDPNGDDDYFNSQGQLIKRTKTGTKIYVQNGKDIFLLTKINLNSASNRQTVANIVGYYASQIGITFQPKGSNMNKGKGIVGLKASEDDPNHNPAFSQGMDIFINKKGNKLSSDLYDYYNLENTLTHENLHKIDFENKVTPTLQTHVQVYLSQIKDPTFRRTTKEWQVGEVGEFSNYLLNYYARETNGGTEQLEKYVNDFNKNNKAGFQISVDVGTASERGYQVNIYKNKKLVNIQNYSKIKNEGTDQ